MLEEEDAEDDSEDFAGSDDEGHDMLPEVADHPVHNDLTSCPRGAQDQHVEQAGGVLPEKHK